MQARCRKEPGSIKETVMEALCRRTASVGMQCDPDGI